MFLCSAALAALKVNSIATKRMNDGRRMAISQDEYEHAETTRGEGDARVSPFILIFNGTSVFKSGIHCCVLIREEVCVRRLQISGKWSQAAGRFSGRRCSG